LLKEEINSTDSQEVLFRSNSVCTKALDHCTHAPHRF
jgi:hypothetical protein